MAQISSVTLHIEHLREALGIGISCPRLSWTLETDIQNWCQGAYEIQCFSADGKLIDQETRSVWDATTGRAVTGQLKDRKLRQRVGVVSFRRAWRDFHPDGSFWNAD